MFFPCSIRECYSKSHWLHLPNLPHGCHLNLSTMFLLSTPPLPTLIYTVNHQRAFNHKSDITLHWPLISLRIKSKLLHVTRRSQASWSLWFYTTAPLMSALSHTGCFLWVRSLSRCASGLCPAGTSAWLLLRSSLHGGLLPFPWRSGRLP